MRSSRPSHDRPPETIGRSGLALVRSATFALLVASALAGCSSGDDGAGPDVLPEPALHTPLWAFEPWISKDISSTDDTRDFVRGFRDRDIPVGVVVLDSPWETNYNTFTPNPVRYHDFGALVSELHASGIRLVCWVTQMVNEDSFDLEPGGDTYPATNIQFLEGERNGYFVDGGKKWFWWKGTGGAVDFESAAARRWWHAQQDQVLALGLDGWKLDFGDSYVATPTVATAAGVIPHQRYSESYYRDFLAYGVHVRGPHDFLTMVRAWDESYQFAGRYHARPEHAPVAWMGDNRRDFKGLEDALDHLFRSAAAGYAVLGSDIGGYLDRDDRDFMDLVPFDSVVFARWTALGALTPFMQLHGRANIAPWTVPTRTDEVVALYRYWATLHHELAPFFYSLAEEAYATKSGAIVHPQGAPRVWPKDYRFVVGDALLVAPILDHSGVREVELPAGAAWYDWWTPGAAPLPGGQTVTASMASDLQRIPVFVRAGAILPARVSSALTGLGDAGSAGKLTLAIWPADQKTSLRVHPREEGGAFVVEAERTADGAELHLGSTDEALVLRVRLDAAPASVTVEGAALDASAWRWDDAGRLAWITLPAADGARTIVVRGATP